MAEDQQTQPAVLARATLQAFDASTYTATLRLDGSQTVFMRAVAVSRGLPAATLAPGAVLAVALLDRTNPGDAMVVAAW